MKVKSVIRFLVFLIALFLMLRFLEPRLVFHPTKTWAVELSSFPSAQEVRFQSSDGVDLSGVWLPAGPPRGPVALTGMMKPLPIEISGVSI